LSHQFSCLRTVATLAAIPIFAAGCAGANSTASSQVEQSYKTAYGLSSAGTTTNLYTEFFGPPQKAAAAPAPLTAAAESTPAQPVPAAAAPQPAQPAATAASTHQSRTATAPSALQQTKPAPAPVEVAQQPAAPQPDVPVAYGITANGPTTDLYTELFGSRRSDGQ